MASDRMKWHWPCCYRFPRGKTWVLVNSLFLLEDALWSPERNDTAFDSTYQCFYEPNTSRMFIYLVAAGDEEKLKYKELVSPEVTTWKRDTHTHICIQIKRNLFFTSM